jgi:phosphoenolpyruvate carboxylase
VHELGVAELLEAVDPGTRYAALGEEASIERFAHELRTAHPLASPFLTYGEETQSELDILREAASARRRYGEAAIENAVISKAASVSDLLELAVLLQGGRPRCPPDGGGAGPLPQFANAEANITLDKCDCRH